MTFRFFERLTKGKSRPPEIAFAIR
jgi:hypothetical protein